MLGKIFGWRLKKEERARLREFMEHKASFDQFMEYLQLKTNLPALHVIKQNNIHKYRGEYGFKVLVETGTYLGDMVDAQRNHFRKIYSVELSQDLYRKAVRRFEQFPHIKVLQGDSGIVLKELLKEINEPALFWLDGHYSSGITAKGAKNTPIVEELEAIMDSPYDHGILIDDARLFTGRGDYPSIDAISTFVKTKDNRRTIAVADDIIRIFTDPQR